MNNKIDEKLFAYSRPDATTGVLHDIKQIAANLKKTLGYNRGFAWQPCWMAETTKKFLHMKIDFVCERRETGFFLPFNMAAM